MIGVPAASECSVDSVGLMVPLTPGHEGKFISLRSLGASVDSAFKLAIIGREKVVVEFN